MGRLFKTWLIFFLVALGGLIAGAALAFIVQEFAVELAIREPIEITMIDGQSMLSSVSLTIDPGIPRTYEFIVKNKSEKVNYSLTYRANVTKGAWSDLKLKLELDPDGPDNGINYTISSVNVDATGDRQRDVILSQELISGGKHCLKLTVRPLHEAASTARTIKLSFTRRGCDLTEE